MRKLLAVLATVAFFAIPVQAAEVSGTVQSVDPATRTITLEDGTSYVAEASVDLEALAPGDNVMITVDDTTTSATSVEEAQ